MPKLAAVPPSGSAPEDVPEGKTGVRRGLVERQILETSAELFAQRGFAATSVQDVADAVGISRPALYHYFRNKDEILARLTDGLIVSAGSAIQEAMAVSMPADQQLALLVRALTVPIAESPGRFRLLLTRDASISPDAQERLHELERTVLRSLTSVIERGVTTGVFRRCEPRTASFAVVGMINWVAWWYLPGGTQTIDELSEALVDFALASLRSSAKASDRSTLSDTLASIRRDLAHLERLAKQQP